MAQEKTRANFIKDGIETQKKMPSFIKNLEPSEPQKTRANFIKDGRGEPQPEILNTEQSNKVIEAFKNQCEGNTNPNATPIFNTLENAILLKVTEPVLQQMESKTIIPFIEVQGEFYFRTIDLTNA